MQAYWLSITVETTHLPSTQVNCLADIPMKQGHGGYDPLHMTSVPADNEEVDTMRYIHLLCF